MRTTASENEPTAGATPRAAGRRRRQGSLHRRLSLLIGLLLFTTVAALAWAAHREVEGAVLEAAHERLRRTSQQLASLLVQSITQRSDEARRLAERPVLRRAIDGDEAALAAARQMLETLVSATPQMLSAELWRGSTERLVLALRPESDKEAVSAGLTRHDPPHEAGFSALQVARGIVFFDVVAAVPHSSRTEEPGSAGPVEGFLLVRRRASTANAADTIGQLLGDGASLRFGSRQGGIWTDLSHVVSVPPPSPSPGALVTYSDDDGAQVLGVEAPVGRTPWAVWVGVPRHTALMAMRSFWSQMVPIGVTIVLLGAGLAWMLSRRITTPLNQITRAAEAIAAGEFDKRVRADRDDEIGRLADAFDSMVDRVEDGYARLDQGIRDRTRELEEALHALKDTQEQLVRREKLAMLGQLASGVGHELRNPLGVMTNAVYYLEMVQPDAEPDVLEYHGILRAQIGLAEKIVGDLLDFSRLKPPRRDNVAVRELVDHQLARLPAAPDIQIDQQIAADLPRVSVDTVQVGQVVFNLLINAVQALEGRDGGRLSLHAAVADGHVALMVDDNGPGVPPELGEKIFEPLFTTKARGIGLGLAVSRSLAETNGGTLSVTEGQAGGARFTLTMPITAATEAVA